MPKAGDGQSLSPGTQLDVYEIEQVLGTGGFGITYKARDCSLACAVAIKEYFPAHLAWRDTQRRTLSPRSEEHDENYRWGLGRFLDEARTLARFKEPGIVRVSRLFEANGTAYLVMDYVDGVSLDARLRSGGTLTEAEALSILQPLLLGLQAVHAQNVLHRDIKPGNIYIRRDGEPVLLDFGAAREALEGQTAMMTMIVTPGYAPMEQYTRDERQGPWSDLYALGATLFHCLNGRPPMAAPDRLAKRMDGHEDPVASQFEQLRERLSPAFVDLLRDLLALNINDRPQSAAEVLARLPSLDNIAGDSLLMDLRQHPQGRRSPPSGPTSRPRSEPVSGGDTLMSAPVPASSLSVTQLERLAERAGGELASRAVLPAVSRAPSAQDAIERIADFIGEEGAREEFQRHARIVLKAAARGSREVTGMLPGEPEPQPRRRSAAPPSHGRAGASPARVSREEATMVGAPSDSPATASTPSGARTIDESFASEVEQRLAESLGPIAAMLVKRALPRAGSHAELVQLLADELDDDAERQRFTRGLL